MKKLKSGRRDRQTIKKKGGSPAPLTEINPNAAGIDIGSTSHYVAVPSDRSDTPVREFASFTADMNALADWLERCGIRTVAMESTGVYWIPLFELLESRGFEVLLVNARHVKNVSGRKSDVLDCQWLQQLLSYGLLKGAYRPADEICQLRSVVRNRENLVRDQGRLIQRMQKAYTEMNIQLGNVLSDLAGVSGMAITRAILKGERDPWVLADLRDGRVRSSREQVAKSLEGNWRPEHLLSLRVAVNLYDAYSTEIRECDREMERLLKALEKHGTPPPAERRPSPSRNAPSFDIRVALYKMSGVDLTRINGIDVNTAIKVLSEIGPDLSRFPSSKHFCSWLGLAPGTRVSGGKILSAAIPRRQNRAAQALRLAAAGLRRSQSGLGAYYRRLCSRMDKGSAIVATAHKLARIIYALLTKGEAYVDVGQKAYEERYHQRVVKNLEKRAKEMGFVLTPAPV